MAKKEINYANLVRGGVDYLSVLEFAPEQIANLRHEDVKRRIRQFHDETSNENKKRGQQLFLSGLWGDRMEAINMAEILLENRRGFEGYKDEYLKQKKFPKLAIPLPTPERGEDYFRTLGFHAHEVAKLSFADIERAKRAFEEFTGPRDGLGVIAFPLLIAEWKETSRALTALGTPPAFEAAQKRYVAEHKTTAEDTASFIDDLQRLVNQERNITVRGRPAHKTVSLAEVLKRNDLSVAGHKLAGLDLKNVECSNVDFSGSDLGSIDLRYKSISNAVFDAKTIIRASTKLEGVKGAEQAIGLLECLETNFRRQLLLKNENPEAHHLYKRLYKLAHPKEPKPDASLNLTSEKHPVSKKDSDIAQERERVKDTRQTVAPSRTPSKRPRYRKTRNTAGQEVLEGSATMSLTTPATQAVPESRPEDTTSHSSRPIHEPRRPTGAKAASGKKAATETPAVADKPFDQEFREREAAAAARRDALEREWDLRIAANPALRYFQGVDLGDPSALDELLAEKSRIPTPPSTPKPGARRHTKVVARL